MKDLMIIKKFFEESKIDYYYGNLNGLRKMILNCYGEIVSKSSLEMLPTVLKDYSFKLESKNEQSDFLVVFHRKSF